ncbi:hypothetical protein CJ030_MR4G003030 [Morella rubra]|uniref:Uncharacterized protein n=1 Tax=Morella rubra TaxID=262757 RepID=A0A6A1VW45_9ROSI|nr:hypothetical protein CJ030_MR4G003030 [Morella rubra]
MNILKSITVTVWRMLARFGQKHSETGTETVGIVALRPPAQSATPRGYNSDNTPRGYNSDNTPRGYNSDASSASTGPIRNY